MCDFFMCLCVLVYNHTLKIVVFMHSYSVYFSLQNMYLYTHKYYINIRETRIKNGQPRDTDNIGQTRDRTYNDGYYTT